MDFVDPRRIILQSFDIPVTDAGSFCRRVRASAKSANIDGQNSPSKNGEAK